MQNIVGLNPAFVLWGVHTLTLTQSGVVRLWTALYSLYTSPLGIYTISLDHTTDVRFLKVARVQKS